MVHAPDRTRRLLTRLGFRLGGEGGMQGQRWVGAVTGPTHNVPRTAPDPELEQAFIAAVRACRRVRLHLLVDCALYAIDNASRRIEIPMPESRKSDGKRRVSIPQIGRKSAAAAAAEALEQAILDGELLMGEMLSEAALCDLLGGVSRTPLREALVELEGKGLVDITPYRGTRVFLLTGPQIEQLGCYRLILELAALDAAMLHAPDALAEEMAQIVADMEKGIDEEQSGVFGRFDTKLHECIIAHSGNQYLIDAYHLVALKLAVLRMLVARNAEAIGASHRDHVDLLRHVTQGHHGEARALLTRHIEGGTRYYAEHTQAALALRAVGR